MIDFARIPASHLPALLRTMPKALRSAIEQCCGDGARVQRCRIHKITNVTERLPKDKAQQVRWLMTQAFKLEVTKGKSKLKDLANN